MTTLRRALDFLRHRHWTGFFAELVLIALGVLLALGVDRNVAAYMDRQSERRYLELLERDLGVTIEMLAEYERVCDVAEESCLRILNELPNVPDVADSVTFHSDLSILHMRRTLHLDDAAYTDPVSTGHLRLLRSRSLRDGIVRFYNEAERTIAILNRNNETFIDGYLASFFFRQGLLTTDHFMMLGIPLVDESQKELRRLLGDSD